MNNNYTLYILKLQNNKYYIGVTTDLQKRYAEHEQGIASGWTKLYAPVKIIKTKIIKYTRNHFNIENKIVLYARFMP